MMFSTIPKPKVKSKRIFLRLIANRIFSTIPVNNHPKDKKSSYKL